MIQEETVRYLDGKAMARKHYVGFLISCAAKVTSLGTTNRICTYVCDISKESYEIHGLFHVRKKQGRSSVGRKLL